MPKAFSNAGWMVAIVLTGVLCFMRLVRDLSLELTVLLTMFWRSFTLYECRSTIQVSSISRGFDSRPKLLLLQLLYTRKDILSLLSDVNNTRDHMTLICLITVFLA